MCRIGSPGERISEWRHDNCSAPSRRKALAQERTLARSGRSTPAKLDTAIPGDAADSVITSLDTSLPDPSEHVFPQNELATDRRGPFDKTLERHLAAQLPRSATQSVCLRSTDMLMRVVLAGRAGATARC